MGVGFAIVESPIKPIWCPVDGTQVLMVGGLVTYGLDTPANAGGVQIQVAASGAGNLSLHAQPFGVVIGTSDSADRETYTTLTTALVNVKTITGVDTAVAQLARQNRGVEGMYGKGDTQALVQVARIGADTVLKGYFKGSATVGTTAITKLTATAGTTTQITTNATQFTPVAQNHTVYCVTGKNAGLYRVGTGTSTTVFDFTRAWPYTPAVGDTFKAVPVRQGMCRMNTDTTYGLWINGAEAYTNYFVVQVYNIDLSQEAGNEYCTFSFIPEMLNPYNNGKSTT
jgi:hypothetical protein